MDSFHFCLSHLDLARCWSRSTLWGTSTHSSHSTHSWLSHTTWHATGWHSHSWLTSHYHVHESHWVGLDCLIDLGIVLLETSHELLIELRVLSHALGQLSELWISHEGHELGVSSATHSHSSSHAWHAAGRHTTSHIFITVVLVLIHTTISWNLI